MKHIDWLNSCPCHECRESNNGLDCPCLKKQEWEDMQPDDGKEAENADTTK